MKTMKVLYEGRVQGVGFRWAIRKMAQGYDVTGEVRNLPDGRVELFASGDASEIGAFLQEVRESDLAGHILNEHLNEITAPQVFRGFQIVE